MFVAIEKITGNKVVGIRFTEKNNHWRILKLNEPVYTIEKFLLGFANSKNPKSFIDATMPEFFRPESDDIELNYEELRLNLDNLLGEGIIPIEGQSLIYVANLCTLVVRCRETFLKTSFSFGMEDNTPGFDISEIYKERTVVEISSLDELIPLLFTKFLSLVFSGEIKSFKKCPVCGKYFIPDKNSRQEYCTPDCREVSYSDNPFYKKYRNAYTDIKRKIPEIALKEGGDVEIREKQLLALYDEWQETACTMLSSATEHFSSPDEYRKAIRKLWNTMKGGKHNGQCES